jgi:putative Ca2+/H+ antiporter (TMEM165/GDT1 family)
VFICKCFIFLFTVAFGWVATIIPRAYTYYISTALFALFGLKMLKDGYYMSPNEAQEEFEEVQLDLRKREDEVFISFMQQPMQDANICLQIGE